MFLNGLLFVLICFVVQFLLLTALYPRFLLTQQGQKKPLSVAPTLRALQIIIVTEERLNE